MVANFGEAIKRPFTDIKILLIGIVLSIIPIVNWLTYGYFLECAKTSKKKKLPEWKEWGSLFVHGLLYLIIGIIYFIPALIFLAIGFGKAFFTLMSSGFLINYGTTASSEALMEQLLPILATNAVFLLIGGILAIIAMYVIFSAIVNYSKTYKFSDAFSSKIWKKAFTGRYLLTFIVFLIYAWVVSWILGYIPIVGPAIASFIVGVAWFTGFGEIYSKL